MRRVGRGEREAARPCTRRILTGYTFFLLTRRWEPPTLRRGGEPWGSVVSLGGCWVDARIPVELDRDGDIPGHREVFDRRQEPRRRARRHAQRGRAKGTA